MDKKVHVMEYLLSDKYILISFDWCAYKISSWVNGTMRNIYHLERLSLEREHGIVYLLHLNLRRFYRN